MAICGAINSLREYSGTMIHSKVKELIHQWPVFNRRKLTGTVLGPSCNTGGKAVPIKAPDTDINLTCLCFYVDTVRVPNKSPSGEPRCFAKFLAPFSVPITYTNPTSYSFHGYTWKWKIFGRHVIMTYIFCKDSTISRSFWGR